MSNRIATTSRVLSSGIRERQLSPTPEIRMTEADVRDPPTLLRILGQIIRVLGEGTQALRSQPRNRSTIFEGLSFTAGTAVSLQHGYGSAVRYAIVGWTGAGGCTLPPVSVNDGSTLTLTPAETGTANLEVWPQ